jgi:Tfp pilus assembly protein FimT
MEEQHLMLLLDKQRQHLLVLRIGEIKKTSSMNQKSRTNKVLKVSQSGFTFIELILYVAILTGMLVTLIPFAWNIIGGGVKSATEQEVFDNARYISQRLKYEIRNATGINSVSSTQISLSTATSATNPTIISSSSGMLTIKQGVGAPIALNSQNASISAFTFTNYTSVSNATKHIQFVFTIVANYPGAGQRQEYKESTTVEGSAEVRSN